MYTTRLFDIGVGQTARVESLHADGAVRRRLLDIGLTRGTRATCLYAAPSGDPKAFLIRGTVIALRSEDSARVQAQAVLPVSQKEVHAWA
ncbi:ferrous iron transport protein A [Christensenellaceae bacterium NSJ-63]|uniref:Ferrous iron transport protein A n=1 Tax=Guopingia tenuis TaxID=2763656 RepID=A0A926HX93_9FIRM|nr:FeoA family protein [Guopingia tenuis]MBC8538521.1 ferrous iron transport protein A [Guopingia tenuis]